MFTQLVCALAVGWLVILTSARVENDPAQRAAALLAKMTLDEKISMLHGSFGSDKVYVGNVPGNDRLGIPPLRMNDGPQGFRDDANVGTTTAFPSGGTVSASWDRDLLYQWGKVMGQEFFGKGANVQLGPGMNLARIPQGGRNFEYLSGADPYLGSQLAPAAIKGIQATGVIANAKHWVENNQETNRDTVDEVVDERTRHEMYYPPFEGAVDAGVGSFMCSYNKISSSSVETPLWSCENPVTLKHDLKGTIGFKGWVMSDWGATHSLSIAAGLDQQMPDDSYFGAALKQAVDEGKVDISLVDDSVSRILTPMFTMGLFDQPNNNTITNVVTSPEHTNAARQIGAESMVLLQNKGDLLPLAVEAGAAVKIALIGMGSVAPVVGGGGSGSVFPSYISTPLQALTELLGLPKSASQVSFQCAAADSFEADVGYAQWGCEATPASSAQDCCDRCGAYAHCTYWAYNDNWCSMYPTSDHKKKAGYNGNTAGSVIRTLPSQGVWQCNSKQQCVAFADGTDGTLAASLAKEADAVLVVASSFAKEGSDRDDLTLNAFTTETCGVVPKGQDELITNVASAAPGKVIVALSLPGAVLTPWRDQVASIIWCGFAGQEFGNALVDVLVGTVNPSSRMAITMPVTENDEKFTKAQFPGIQRVGTYSEKLLVDYRWYTAHNMKPAFPFGHGLGYSTFQVSDFVINGRDISVSVTNTGKRQGKHVVQIYVAFPAAANSPPLQLKGFDKTQVLAPGATQKLAFTLNDRALSVWDDQVTHDWKLVPGVYTVYVGHAVDNLPLKGQINV